MSIKELYPQEIIDAMGGVEAIEKLEVLDVIIYFENCPILGRNQNLVIPKHATIKRGFDTKGRPFLVVFVPDFAPLYYHTRYKDPTAFTNSRNWWIWGKEAMSDWDSKTYLPILAMIMKGEECLPARRYLASANL